MRVRMILVAAGAALTLACGPAPAPAPSDGLPRYREDVELLKANVQVVELADDDGARVAIVPVFQGRVMTSTATGPDGWSLGWINGELITSWETLAHINPYGGEDRFWLGPEGGQYAVFFEKGAPFDLEHWQTPPLIDTEPFELMAASASRAVFRRRASLANYSGFVFDLQIDRTVRLLGEGDVRSSFRVDVPDGVDFVAFESENRLTNTGEKPWEKETGLLSIWILGMFPPSEGATVVIPFIPGPEEDLGPVVNDAYFGKVPADRLIVGTERLFFRADGQYRSKIGLSPSRATSVCGSYDPERGVLTLVEFTIPLEAHHYVNSMWEIQDEPYAGDVVNSYNDGPPEPGAKPMGPFYELESSSPALELGPGESYVHVHRTAHFQGSEEALDPIARAALGVGIAEIKAAFGD
ncbi:MAG: hypothetical protein LJF30_11560 [Acidobacteria bacterium]|jgi:hypothetical protein|nr:hypothetical protein [Acidobacteriota bacterium]